MRRHDDSYQGSNMKQLIALLAVAFVVTLGVVIGTRMSSDAIAVLAGVIAGVAAGIPTALLLMAVTRRREQEYTEAYDEPYRATPPVIVVTPGNAAQQQLPHPMPYPYQASPAPYQRQFRVMGYEEEDDTTVETKPGATHWYQ